MCLCLYVVYVCYFSEKLKKSICTTFLLHKYVHTENLTHPGKTFTFIVRHTLYDCIREYSTLKFSHPIFRLPLALYLCRYALLISVYYSFYVIPLLFTLTHMPAHTMHLCQSYIFSMFVFPCFYVLPCVYGFHVYKAPSIVCLCRRSYRENCVVVRSIEFSLLLLLLFKFQVVYLKYFIGGDETVIA